VLSEDVTIHAGAGTDVGWLTGADGASSNDSGYLVPIG